MTTNELWAKFVEWMKSREGYPFAGQFVNTMWTAYQAAHTSRDAEVEALRKDVGGVEMTAEEFYNDFKEALQILNIPWGRMQEVTVFVEGSVVKYSTENKMYTIDYAKR